MLLFELHNADVRYNGRQVLANVSLSIDQGERVALVGKSGAGKSTLLKLFYEQQRTDAAIVPQDLGLVKPLSVFHNVYMGRLHRHRSWYNLVNLIYPLQHEKAAVKTVVDSLELGEDMLFASVGELSGGQQQRIAVARAIHQGGRVLLGDEPVSSVDDHQSRVVLEAISAAYQTVIIAMHDVSLALAYSNRVVGLKDGRIVMDQAAAGLESTDLDFLYRS
ncbi:MAG: ATP-binding cassette domain-containing protein [Candidatus Competibacteraceae bacterium]|jgi:phosphonate transport system ATP-binding protein|nr:ATP-binding cassette domain-containing protein [Candidatus Competibacteraceae bacterium]